MTERDVSGNILKAKALIADENLWLKRQWFSQEPGQPMKRCAYSALCAITRDMPVPECEALAIAMGSEARGSSAGTKVMNFNDNNSHEKLMALFDSASLSSAQRVGK